MSLAELTDEQREVRDLARRFADEVVAPQAAAWDAERRFPRGGPRPSSGSSGSWASASPRRSAAWARAT